MPIGSSIGRLEKGWYDGFMQNGAAGVRSLFLWLFLILLLTACTASADTQSALPTQAVAAVLPDTQTPTAALDPALVPPTWTPAPGATSAAAGNFTELSSLGPTNTPTVTRFIPTNTPRPTRTNTPTVTPLPVTPTPYVSYIPDLPPSTDLGPSKMGLHIIRANDANILEFVKQGHPAVIKAVDNFGYLAEVKAASPRTIVVGRINYPQQLYTGSPEEAAQKFVTDQLDQYLINTAVDYWEGWNEPDPNLDNMPWYARFEQERIRLLAQHGLKAAIGGFATGVPEMDEFALFLPAIETAKEYKGILSLHEYGAPDMTYLYGEPLPGFPAYPDRGSLTFRYRWYYREFLEPLGLVIPLVISEAGIDGIIGNRPGPDGFGWADFQDYWVQQGWADNGVDAFIKQLAWYDNGVREDGYVIGFTVFTAGGHGQWSKYDINPILPQLIVYVRSQQ
ncbi:MAG: hypothetical protein H6667_06830 [Ardenticatenaceae bacterium]|nr:hypothetical protein [Ardenticatenaceae bacterium]MCB9445101.1 hypothetical protein [Ardenticatenaceae bacterium]